MSRKNACFTTMLLFLFLFPVSSFATTVLEVSPADGVDGVPLNPEIHILFSGPMIWCPPGSPSA